MRGTSKMGRDRDRDGEEDGDNKRHRKMSGERGKKRGRIW